MGYFLRSCNDTDLVQCSDLWAEAAVYAKNFTVDDGAKGHEVKDLTARFPDGCIAVLLDAFFVESVNLGDLSGLVVAPEEGHTVRVSGAANWSVEPIMRGIGILLCF